MIIVNKYNQYNNSNSCDHPWSSNSTHIHISKLDEDNQKLAVLIKLNFKDIIDIKSIKSDRLFDL